MGTHFPYYISRVWSFGHSCMVYIKCENMTERTIKEFTEENLKEAVERNTRKAEEQEHVTVADNNLLRKPFVKGTSLVDAYKKKPNETIYIDHSLYAFLL